MSYTYNIWVKKLSKENCLATKFPDIAKEWHPTLNKITPNEIMPGSGKQAWWLCSICHQSYKTIPNSRTHSGTGCPYCAGQKVCDWNCLATKYPNIAKQWHPTKNKKLTPKDITCSTTRKVWWFCLTCKESYEMSIVNKTKQNCGCPYCSCHKICNWNCLATQKPYIAQQWHISKNGKLTPHDVAVKSNKKVWWTCPICHEDYQATILNRTNEYNCPYCTGQKVCDWNCLATKCPEIAKQWHPTKNKKLTPKNVSCGSRLKVWWLCPECKKPYQANLYKRTNQKKPSSCPHCNIYYKEKHARDILEKITQRPFHQSQNISWMINKKTKRKYQVDGYNPDLNIILEHQGSQHCRVEPRFHPHGIKDFFYQLYKDADKYQLCKKNNCILICTYYDQTTEEISDQIHKVLHDI